MSADPTMMAQLLSSRLGGPATVGGNGSPQMAVPGQGMNDIAQKLMLLAALRKPPQSQGPVQQPDPNMMGSINGMPAQMNQQPVPGGSNA